MGRGDGTANATRQNYTVNATQSKKTHVVETALVLSDDVCSSEELAGCVDVDGASLCVVVEEGRAGVVVVELAGGAHSAAMTTWTSSSSCVVHCCWRQLSASCWIFLFAHRHCTSVLRMRIRCASASASAPRGIGMWVG